MTTTDDLIVRAQAVLDAAEKMTPGPWKARGVMIDPEIACIPHRPSMYTLGRTDESTPADDARADTDATGIAILRNAAPAVIRDLLARLADPARGLTVGAPFRDARRHPRFLDGTAIISLYGSEDEHQIRSTDKHGAFLRDTHHADAFHTRWRRRDGRWSHWHYADIADDDQPCRLVPLADADRDPATRGPL